MSDCRKKNGNCTVADDPDDELPVQCVGSWSKEKHGYVRKFLEATRSVRASYLPPRGDGGTAFIDLFAGPGRARVRENVNGLVREPAEFIDGSPLIALCEPNISDIVLCELDSENLAALRSRTSHSRKVSVVEGDCNKVIDEIVAKIPRRGYSLALLDPFSASALAFNTIRRLAAFPRMDLIIHFPIGSMKRSFENYRIFERFLGVPPEQWGVAPIAEGIDPREQPAIVHGEDVRGLLDVMRRQLRSLGYADHEITVRTPTMRNTSNVVLYYLIFASKHVLGDEIWNSVTKNAPNGQLRLL